MKIEPNQHYPDLKSTHGLDLNFQNRSVMFGSSFEESKNKESQTDLENFSILEAMTDISREVLPVEHSIAHSHMTNKMGARSPIRICDLESDDPDRSVFAYINGHRDITMIGTPYSLIRYMRALTKIREFPNYDTISMPKVKVLWNNDVYHLDYLLHKELGIPSQSLAGRLVYWLSHLLVSRKIGDEYVNLKLTEDYQKRWDDWMKAADLYLTHFSKNN